MGRLVGPSSCAAPSWASSPQTNGWAAESAQLVDALSTLPASRPSPTIRRWSMRIGEGYKLVLPLGNLNPSILLFLLLLFSRPELAAPLPALMPPRCPVGRRAMAVRHPELSPAFFSLSSRPSASSRCVAAPCAAPLSSPPCGGRRPSIPFLLPCPDPRAKTLKPQLGSLVPAPPRALSPVPRVTKSRAVLLRGSAEVFPRRSAYR